MIELYELAATDDKQVFSPYCWRIRLALHHKGLPFKSIPWRMTEKDRIAFADTERVPVLVDGEHGSGLGVGSQETGSGASTGPGLTTLARVLAGQAGIAPVHRATLLLLYQLGEEHP